MTEMQIVILSAIGAYFILMLLIGLWAAKNDSHEGFVIGSRNVGLIPTIGSLASGSRDGMGVVFWVGFGLTVGYGGLWLCLGVVFAFLLYALFGSTIRKKSQELDAVTIGEMIRYYLGQLTEKMTALIVVVFSLVFVSAQLYVSGNIFAEVLQIDSWIGISSVACVVGLYLFIGGYSTVVKTDAIQFFLIISFVCIPFFVPPAKADALNMASLFTLPVIDEVALFFIGFFYILSASDIWQRLFSARNDRVIRLGFPLAGVGFTFMTLSLIWLGMGSKGLLAGEVENSRVLFELFSQGAISPWVLSYLAVVIMAVTMSTLDTSCYLFAASLTKNIFPKEKTVNRKVYIRFTRFIMLFALIVMSFVALTISDVIQSLFNAASLLFILAPVYLSVGFGWVKRSKKLDMFMALSIIISVVVYLAMFIRGDLASMIALLIPVALNSALVLLGLLGQRFLSKTT